MKLKGVLDFSLGNFLCLRGFAPMGLLYDLSEPDPSIQRDLLTEHRDEMIAFLSQGEFLFFPEVILSATLSHDGESSETINRFFEGIRSANPIVNAKFDDFRLAVSSTRTSNPDDRRAYDVYRTATLRMLSAYEHKFSRIDGNHRLSATPEDPKFADHNVPFCLIFFRNTTEAARFSRALFHNINYKQVPLTMEQNLELILDDSELFSDDKLKTHPSFGWPYYLARQLHNKLDFDLLPNLKPFIEKESRTFFVQQLAFLIKKEVIRENENAIKRFKEGLVKVNSLFDVHTDLKESRNPGLLAALVYYALHTHPPFSSFIRWILQNHLQYIPITSEADLISIFDRVLDSRKRTIFVSTPFGKDAAENHYLIIERVCKEINIDYNLKPPLKVERVDWFKDGTSYEINDKIIEMISDCGLLIGNLTCCNPNVYNEIGFIMGKARAEENDVTNMLLFLDESVPDEKDKFVGFSLKGIMQLRFTQTEQFAADLKENFFQL